MNIALIGPASVIHYQRWAYSLAELGHEVHIISQHPDKGIAESPLFASKTWLPIRSPWGYIGNIPKLHSTIARIKPDIVNAHYGSGYGLCSSLISGYPYLLSVWGSDVYDFPNESQLKKYILRWNLSRASAIASTSHTMKQQVMHILPEPGKIYVTPFGVDCIKFHPDPNKDRKMLTIGIVKTLAKKYGIDNLIQAFAKLLTLPSVKSIDSQYPLQLLIVGDGPENGSLTKMVAELGICDRTTFAGRIEHNDIPTWLHRMDIFVAPSRLDSESFGVAVIEASACGIPVIVSDVGGLPEVVDDGVTGIVVAKENIHSLTFAMEKLVLNSDLRFTMGNAGRKKVIENYEWQGCINNMINCYESTIMEYSHLQ